jgi:hypothetical protein
MNAIVFKLTAYNERLAVETPVDVEQKGTVAAILALAGSVLAAMYVTLGLHAYFTALRWSMKKKFKEFFGLDRVDHGTVIVLPRFSVGTSNSSTSERGTNGITLKNLDELDRRCISLDDIVAVRYLMALFAEHGFSPPKLFFDDDAHSIVFNGKATSDPELDSLQRAKNIIAIGVFSNELTTTVAHRKDRTDNRSFRLSAPEAYFSGARQLDIAPTNASLDEWRQQSTHWVSECRDAQFALLAKVLAPGERQIIILGGSTAKATRKLAKYLQRGWLQTYEYKIPGRRSRLGGNPFSRFYLVANEDQRDPDPSYVHYSDA